MIPAQGEQGLVACKHHWFAPGVGENMSGHANMPPPCRGAELAGDEASAWRFHSSALLLVLPLMFALLAEAVLAGQKTARFTASLRIDPALVRRDLERLRTASVATTPSSLTSASAGSAAAASAGTKSTTSATTVRRLRRADGSGWCTRVSLAGGGVRWVCK